MPFEGYCCTSAIFSGSTTADGRPIIWKNRDSGFMNNRVDYMPACDSIRYSFLYLSNSKSGIKEAWSGLNSAGFSIMNTVSYNIRQDGDNTPASKMDREGVVMFRALASCATLEDFENLLDSLEQPFGLEANFGVIDANGGAAYYEVNNYTWIKYDVNDPEVAPDGYLIRSNYSFSGKEGKGQGYVRYNNASKIISDKLSSGDKIDVRFIMDSLSRSFYQSQLWMNPLEEGKSLFVDRDFIPRKSTCAVTIIQGVRPGEDTSLGVMWCALGYPPAAQIIPMKVESGDLIPADMTSHGNSPYAAACTRALKRKAKIFSIDFKDGKKYVNFDVLRGIMSDMQSAEDKIFDNFAAQFNREQIKAFYEAIEIR